MVVPLRGHTDVRRSSLRKHEAAHVLQVTLAETKRLLRRKTPPRLHPVYSGRRRDVDAVHLAEMEEVRSSPLAQEVLAALLTGRLMLERPLSEHAQPASLITSVRALALSDRPPG